MPMKITAPPVLRFCALALFVACADNSSSDRPDRDAPATDLQGRDSAAASASAPASDVRGRDSAAAVRPRTILFLGTSLSAGFGVGADSAFPALIQTLIDSAGLPFHVVNSGLSGETSAGGLRRLDWSLQQPVHVLVLELGANDGLRGLDPRELRENLDAILTRTRDRYPDAALIIAGMEAPPNLGPRYTADFRNVFTSLADEHGAVLIPFLLEGVAGVPRLNQDDRIHPNSEGHRIIARTVWAALERVLHNEAGGR
ncbi:MAG: arylesterase [Longimicrobiales bacterium]